MTFKINIPADPNIIDTFIPHVSAWKSKEIHHVWIQAFIFRTYSRLARSHPVHRGRDVTQPRIQPGNQDGGLATWAQFWALQTWGQQKGMGFGNAFRYL